MLSKKYTSEVKHAIISGASLGDNTVIAAIQGKKIRVHSLALLAAASVAIRFESGAGGTALTGVMTTDAGMVLPHNEYGWFETAKGALLNMELGGAVQVSGMITYTELAEGQDTI